MGGSLGRCVRYEGGGEKGLRLRVKDDGNPLHACDRSIVVELHNWMSILLPRVNHDLGQHDTCRSFVVLSRQTLAFCRFGFSICTYVVLAFFPIAHGLRFHRLAFYPFLFLAFYLFRLWT